MPAIVSAIVLVAFTLAHSTATAQIRALDTTTPAFIDVELGEIAVHEGHSVAVVNLHRSGDFRQSSRCDFRTEEITATEGVDYKGTGGTLVFQPGEGMKQINIPILRDRPLDASKTFRVILSDPGPKVLLMREEVLVTIQPAAPALQILSRSPAEITLAWEGTHYSVERSSDAANWQSLPCTKLVSGSRCEVTLPAEGTRYIYRLKAE